jgi:hypothetical protein
LLFVVRRNGTFFKASPANVAVETELYTRFGESGEKDTEIEEWFNRQIETPFVNVLPKLLEPRYIHRRPLPVRDRAQELEIRKIGFLIPNVVETLVLERQLYT